MSLKYRQDVSFRLANFFLYVVGFWFAANRIEEWFRNAAILYTIVTVFFVMWLQLRGLYFSWGNFEVCMYMACNSIALVLDIIKIFVLVVRKKKFLGLIEYMQKNFFHLNYDQDENSIIAHAKRTCIYFVCVFSFCSQSTVFSYIIRPFVSNLGKNESDREHIYDMWLDLPLSVTPYYEITYIIQALSVYQVGVCYLCFDNIFFIMCLHVAGQFRILQYRIANVSGLSEIVKSNDNTSTAELYSEKCYIKFKNCIQQHQALIEFCEILEEVFTVIVLGQVLMFSIIICFAGYEVLLITLPFESRVAFTCFLITGVSQLWMFTYSCNCITTESLNIAESVYAGPWINLPMDKFGKLLRKDLQVLILRARRPSALTACGFFSITLETFTKIMSTSMSYFTLLKQSAEDTVIKNLGHIKPEVLLSVYNLCLRTNVIPTTWKTANLMIIPKTLDGDKQQLSAYRPIALLPVTSKIFERILDDRIQVSCIEQNLTSEEQYGFKKGFGIEDVFFKFKEEIAVTNKKKRKIVIRTKHGKISHRVQRGSILGSAAWNWSLEQFLGQISNIVEADTVQVLAYADDILFVIKGYSRVELERHGSIVMTTLQDWCHENKLSDKKKKTVAVFVRGKLDIRRPSSIKINQNTVRHTHEYKYLGITKDSKLNFISHVKRLREKFSIS
ncbi:PREDICTED: odorant receptor 13a-like [Habropoda laboriosa]|uniref:odorant receptor 13a-like n=1 Tax=Habropoda laboriosa TaxID=597456 RepID=UPI00083D9425|nr:PREDICTED: odorant receptor 13a-like [Habropoda laboriosa]